MKAKHLLSMVASLSLSCTSSQAAVVFMDLTGYTAPNAGIAYNDPIKHYSITVSPDPDDEFALYNDSEYIGIDANWGATIAVNGSSSTSPKIFNFGETIDSSWATFSAAQYRTTFRSTGDGTESASIGNNQYMGFQTGSGQYGWLEVTYNATTNTFQLVRGAIETTAGVAILAGVTPVPEPGSLLLVATGALALLRRNRCPSEKI